VEEARLDPAGFSWGNPDLRSFSSGHGLAAAAVFACAIASALSASHASAEPISDQMVEIAPARAFDMFLDRLMAAESGGRRDAKNPRSSALGPFQFIKSTFLDIARRHLATEIAGLSEEEILDLRRDRELSRRAAAAFCRENVAFLKEQGIRPTFAHLRLAFLLGPADAARIVQAQERTAVRELLAPAVIKANPFMRRMSVSDLLAKSERDLSARG
jgi:hypothetical protein